LILLAVLAVPAAAHSMFVAPPTLCFASGSATYRIDPGAGAPDYRIKIATDAPRPDLRMTLVDRAEIADFVLVDDFNTPDGTACNSSAPIRTVKLDAAAPNPDVTVSLSGDGSGADYKLFVHSVRFSHQDAAALLAAMWKAAQRREVAARATP
jgi:hypothetical protein